MINKKITHILIDFDGVLTDNFVYLSEDGIESVKCSRADGLAIDILKKLKYEVFIFSTEKNIVVTKRAKKLKLKVFQGIGNKKDFLIRLAKKNTWNLKNFLYIGNDLNDYEAMKLCGYSACPSDSDKNIKNIATYNLTSVGGSGVMREIIELLGINTLSYYLN